MNHTRRNRIHNFNDEVPNISYRGPIMGMDFNGGNEFPVNTMQDDINSYDSSDINKSWRNLRNSFEYSSGDSGNETWGSYDSESTLSTRGSLVSKMIPRWALKAGGLKIAADDIKSILEDLETYTDTQIDKLPPSAKEKFDRLCVYTQVLYDTDDYETYYSWIRKHYGHLTTVYPGTVGTYMVGCDILTSLSEEAPGCGIACAASIPRPKSDSNFWHCDNTVILAIYDGGKYRINLFHRAEHPENHTDAYLYVNSTDPRRYPGFSSVEKKRLIELGIEKVKVYGFNSDGRNYVELTNDLVSISELKPRNRHHSYSTKHHHRKPHQPTKKSNWWMIILVIFIIIVLIIIGWFAYRYYWRTSNDSSNILKDEVSEGDDIGDHFDDLAGPELDGSDSDF